MVTGDETFELKLKRQKEIRQGRGKSRAVRWMKGRACIKAQNYERIWLTKKNKTKMPEVYDAREQML